MPTVRSTTPAFAEILESFTAPALALARRVVVDAGMAEDVVQEAFLAYWRNPAAYDTARGSFRTWFLALVHHKAVDAVRHESSLRRRADALAERSAHDVVDDLADGVADRLAASGIPAALRALPPVQREVLVLAYWGGYTQREIAARTGTPLGTVKTRMLTGMRRMQAGLAAVSADVLPVAAVS